MVGEYGATRRAGPAPPRKTSAQLVLVFLAVLAYASAGANLVVGGWAPNTYMLLIAGGILFNAVQGIALRRCRCGRPFSARGSGIGVRAGRSG